MPVSYTHLAYLEKCGAVITGAGTECIRVRGKGVLQSAEFFAKPDRIVAGTYMAAVAACGGSVYLQGVTPSLCRGFLDVSTGTYLMKIHRTVIHLHQHGFSLHTDIHAHSGKYI